MSHSQLNAGDHTNMSSHNFTFPPPPQAPPKASPSHPGVSKPFAGPNGYRGRETRGQHSNRGHGRGFNQGYRRGQYGASQMTPSYGSTSLRVDNGNTSSPHIGHNIQTNGYRMIEYPLPRYSSVQPLECPTKLLQGYEQQNPALSTNALPPQAAYPLDGKRCLQDYNRQQQYSSHDYGSSPSTIRAPLPATQNSNSLQTNTHAGRPFLMGPPNRMGFDAQRNGHQAQQHPMPTVNRTKAYRHGLPSGNESPYLHSSPIGFPSGGHQSPNLFPGYRDRSLKRGHGEAFYRPQIRNHRTQVSPAVPSFGGPLPLPMKPPALHEDLRRPRKKKRKQNQLGLTPKAEDHESSEEEGDDADEEAKLAAVAASAGQGRQLLHFAYKGRTSTLQSLSDVTAWLNERKKRFPTKARAAEIAEGKKREEQQRLTKHLRVETQEKHRAEVRDKQDKKRETEKQLKKGEKISEDAAAKSKRKVEKLRKQLRKEEKRITKVEADAIKDEIEVGAKVDRADGLALGNKSKKRKRSASNGSDNAKVEDIERVKLKLMDPLSILPDPLTPTSQPASADEERYSPPISLNADGASGQLKIPSTGQEGGGFSFPDMDRSILDPSISMSDSSADSSSTNSVEITSSSGSSSNDDDNDEAPDETYTRRKGLERVAPPERANSKQICREFLRKGLCKRGSRCQYLHELPERKSRGMGSQVIKRAEGRKERVGLYQRLLEQEKEQEDHAIVEAILHLVGKGLLEKGVQAVNKDDKAI